MRKELYKDFLRHCRSALFTVSAHKDVPNKGHSFPPHHQILVNRPGDRRWTFGPACSESDLEDFVSNASDIGIELRILLHEYGHVKCRHIDLDLTTSEGKQRGYDEEVEAWSVGRELLITLGANSQELNEYDRETHSALQGYHEGLLKGLGHRS